MQNAILFVLVFSCAAIAGEFTRAHGDSVYAEYCKRGDTATAQRPAPVTRIIVDKKDVFPQTSETVTVEYSQRIGDKIYVKTADLPRWVDEVKPVTRSGSK
jgi:hypothetical protein